MDYFLVEYLVSEANLITLEGEITWGGGGAFLHLPIETKEEKSHPKTFLLLIAIVTQILDQNCATG